MTSEAAQWLVDNLVFPCTLHGEMLRSRFNLREFSAASNFLLLQVRPVGSDKFNKWVGSRGDGGRQTNSNSQTMQLFTRFVALPM